ncbi:MAG: gluconate 2-dehydrogenase subunit 3 family protein [Longimicrobiales bacterium]
MTSSDEGPRSPRRLSRRELLKAASAAGAVALVAGRLKADEPAEASASSPEGSDPGPAGRAGPEARAGRSPQAPRAPMVNLTAQETALLTAMVDRLIPSDEHGPGAVESGALQYIDRLLGAPLSEERDAYRTGLAGLDRYSRYSRGARFTELEPAVQDSVLLDLDTGSATGSGAGFGGSSAVFFNMVKNHVWEAMFGDPHYGGNRDFAGWDLVGYPGPRLGVSAEDQARLEAGELEPVRRSAYDYSRFQR